MSGFDRAPRLLDVAHAAGVSLATASRVLAGRDGVSPALAEQVRRTAATLGYVPNTHARALAGAKSAMVGLVVHDVADPYFAEIAKGVLRVAERHDLMILINQSDRRPETELARIRSLRAHRVGYLVLAGSGYVEPDHEAAAAAELVAFRKIGGRVALIGRHHIPVDSVLPDNRAGARTMADHLISLGHRVIGVAAGPAVMTTVHDRLAGVIDAVAAAGLPAESVVVEHDEFTREGGAAATSRLVRRPEPITAIMALTDVMAMGALDALRAASIAVPEDMSLAGFDDVTVAADLAPALTTVRLPMSDMGAAAMGMTLRAPAVRPRRKRTRHELVVRGSTAPARPRRS